MSTEPLKEYFDCLRMFTSGVIERVDSESGMDLVKVKQLIEQDCLNATDASSMVAYSFLDVSITPHGAVVLAEWSKLLSQGTPKSKLLNALGKFMWLLAGMLITVSGSLLLKAAERL